MRFIFSSGSFLVLLALFLVAGSAPAWAEAVPSAAPHLEGSGLGLMWAVPFMGMLLSIAVVPLMAPNFWHAHFGKVSAFWALAFLIPCTLVFGAQTAIYELAHIALLDYIPFIILLLALYTVAGGVRLRGTVWSSPGVNTMLLLIGTIVASFMGTTGAAMLLIRPLIEANIWRRHNVHVLVFFIFLVANVGGSLTPLGDPPLFLGFLKGVDFFWPMVNLFLPMALVVGILLAVFFLLDSYFFRMEVESRPPEESEMVPLSIEGWVNILLLTGVILAVLLSGFWMPGISFTVNHVPVQLQNIVRDLLLLGLVFASLTATRDKERQANAFSWFPMMEVAKLFAGIFITIIPAIAILKAGGEGALAAVVDLVSENGEPVNAMYFWVTGLLSSFLDNAPTYLVFFNTAGGDAETLMGPLSATLVAISCGAVFMGAMTYIGNAPNFMVRAIAEERGIAMPSFFGYMGWSLVFLAPAFMVVTQVFF
ncbi:MAG: sodium:proton antiporter [Alphaproteobacteria bacterium]|nr:sodium:proton antiporter [Alphaproteobacteria bacterium]